MKDQIKKIMEKDISRKKFLTLIGSSILAMTFLSKTSLADIWLRDTDETMININNLVPYEGANQDVNLNTNNLFTSGIGINKSSLTSTQFHNFSNNSSITTTAINEYNNTTSLPTSNYSLITLKNYMYKTTNDNYSGNFTGNNMTCLLNQIDLRGTINNNPTVAQNETIIANSSDISIRTKMNMTKNSSQTIIGTDSTTNLVSAQNLGTGTLTRNMYGIRSMSSFYNGNNLLTNYYGIYINPPSPGVTDSITNSSIGLYLKEAKDAPTNYQIYSVKGDSYFEEGNIYLDGDMHADDYITNSKVPNINDGKKALDDLKNINNWIDNVKGSINYDEHYAKVEYIQNKSTKFIDDKETIFKPVIVKGLSMETRVSQSEKRDYELLEKINILENQINILEQKNEELNNLIKK